MSAPTVAVTGAAGKTGRAVTGALLRQGARVRLLARDERQAATLAQRWQGGAVAVVAGDVRARPVLDALLVGAQVIYHICPNMAPDELEIGHRVIAAARAASETAGSPIRIVYHSVLHPQTPEMPHHWQKNLLEGALWRCGLPVSVLQPAAYMQNILPGLARMRDEGLYTVPYAVSTRIGMVDLGEVAEAAAQVCLGAGHAQATYELANGEGLSQREVAAHMAAALGRPVHARSLPRTEWRAEAEDAGLSRYAIETLIKMFVYYESYGFCGGAGPLHHLLGRAPIPFAEWARRVVAGNDQG